MRGTTTAINKGGDPSGIVTMEAEDMGRKLDDEATAMSSGNYDPYALAWRYLGAYLDCSSNGDDEQGDDADSYFQRILLWAGYRNTAYHGNAIGEYSFYDWRTSSWDTTTCDLAGNEACTRLDCHHVNPTNFELVGVYKEIYGLDDWAEQLFKHQAYCVWGEDQGNDDDQGNGEQQQQQEDYDDYYYSGSTDYEFMQSFLGDWQGGCNQLDGDDEQGLYVDTMPLQGGNLVYGLYSDAACQTPSSSSSSSSSYSEYLLQQQQSNDENKDNSQKQAEALETAWGRWNDLLNDFKVCQPCRAYSRVQNKDDDEQQDEEEEEEDYYQQEQYEYEQEEQYYQEQQEQAQENNQQDRRHRFLDDGNGDAEPNGFDCYDDAGYLNCNQCYKFESKTDLEEASVEDLELASSQGTIMAIVVNGVQYGQGRGKIDSYANTISNKNRGNLNVFGSLDLKRVLIALGAMVLLTAAVVLGVLYCGRGQSSKRTVQSNKPPRRRRRWRLFFWRKPKEKGLLENF